METTAGDNNNEHIYKKNKKKTDNAKSRKSVESKKFLYLSLKRKVQYLCLYTGWWGYLHPWYLY